MPTEFELVKLLMAQTLSPIWLAKTETTRRCWKNATIAGHYTSAMYMVMILSASTEAELLYIIISTRGLTDEDH